MDIEKLDIKITTSSFLREGNILHLPSHTHDNDLKTAWVEGVSGFGYREWIKYDINMKPSKSLHGLLSVNYLIIHPGFGYSEEIFKQNNRVKSLIFMMINHK